VKFLSALIIVIALTGCSTFKRGEGEIGLIKDQKLSSSFKQDTIKIETNCKWYNPFKTDCEVIAIESVASTSTNGNSENNLRTALVRANMMARANVRHFIQEEITSTKVKTTVAKNIEKANDRLKSRAEMGEVVKMSDDEAEKETNYAVRENSNNTAYTLTETIRTNAQGILKGFKTTKQEVTGNQTVTVTIRWDIQSDRASDTLRRRFNLQ